MFNGIIFNRGTVIKLRKSKNSLYVGIKSNINIKKKDIGDSISCNGVCLTLNSFSKNILFFYVSKETLDRSNFKNIEIGDFVNLEKSLIYGANISGHYIQGHVDTTGQIEIIKIIDKSWIMKIKMKDKFKKFLIEKGSIAINGVSLTINKVIGRKFELTIIPHTLKLTNLINLKKKNIVNIEFDIFGKYLLKISK